MPRFLVPAATLGLIPCVLACQSAASQGVQTVQIVRQQAPASVALLPVRQAETTSLAPLQPLRDSAVQELTDRGFTPLSRSFVDREVQGGARPASALRFPSSGVLEIVVHEWDDAAAPSAGRLYADLEAAFYAEDGGLVGTVRQAGTLALDEALLSALSPAERRARLVRQAVRELLAPFPGPPPL